MYKHNKIYLLLKIVIIISLHGLIVFDGKKNFPAFVNNEYNISMKTTSLLKNPFSQFHEMNS